MNQAVLNNIIEKTCDCCKSVTLSIIGASGTPNLYFAGAQLEISNDHLWQKYEDVGGGVFEWVTFQTGGFTPLGVDDQDIVRVVHTEDDECTYYSNVFMINNS